MPDYNFSISLRISHPEVEPESISKELNLSPDFSYKKGEQRKTKNGRLLKGNYSEMFWSQSLTGNKNLDAQDILLEDFLTSKNNDLSNHQKYFEFINNSGGSVDYFIGWFSEDSINMSIYLKPELMKKTAELGISITLCAYPPSDET